VAELKEDGMEQLFAAVLLFAAVCMALALAWSIHSVRHRPPTGHEGGMEEAIAPEQARAPHDLLFPGREVSWIEQEKLDAGYKYLGWLPLSGSRNPDYLRCIELAHDNGVQKDMLDNPPVGHSATYWCDECRLVWKEDVS
jgi:hypothetical protein